MNKDQPVQPKCPKCGHSDGVSDAGFCNQRVELSREANWHGMYCGCKCDQSVQPMSVIAALRDAYEEIHLFHSEHWSEHVSFENCTTMRCNNYRAQIAELIKGTSAAARASESETTWSRVIGIVTTIDQSFADAGLSAASDERKTTDRILRTLRDCAAIGNGERRSVGMSGTRNTASLTLLKEFSLTRLNDVQTLRALQVKTLEYLTKGGKR